MFTKKEKAAISDDLKKVFDDHKIKRKNKTKELLNDLLNSSEVPEFALECRKGSRLGIMVLTDQRIVWASTIAGMPDIYTLNRDEMTGLDTDTNAANLVTFTLNQSGQKTVFDYGLRKPVFELIKRLN